MRANSKWRTPTRATRAAVSYIPHVSVSLLAAFSLNRERAMWRSRTRGEREQIETYEHELRGTSATGVYDLRDVTSNQLI